MTLELCAACAPTHRKALGGYTRPLGKKQNK